MRSKTKRAKDNAKPILYESKSIGKVEFYKDPTLNEISKKLSAQFKKQYMVNLLTRKKNKK